MEAFEKLNAVVRSLSAATVAKLGDKAHRVQTQSKCLRLPARPLDVGQGIQSKFASRRAASLWDRSSSAAISSEVAGRMSHGLGHDAHWSFISEYDVFRCRNWPMVGGDEPQERAGTPIRIQSVAVHSPHTLSKPSLQFSQTLSARGSSMSLWHCLQCALAIDFACHKPVFAVLCAECAH